jgi:hypothetical protein
LIREVLSEGAMTDDERMLMAYRITTKTRLPPMQPLFKMFDTPCFYRGELVAACGKAKSGKTLFLSVIMAACLTEKVMALERHTENVSHTDSTDNTDKKPLRVLWVDTEQSQQSTQDIIVNRIIPLIENCHTDSTDDTDSTHSCQAQPVPKALSEISEISVCEKKSVCDIKSVCDTKTICVVEAEKSAVILSARYPEYVWLAAGGLGEVQTDKFRALRGRKVVMFPDTDPDGIAYRRWYEAAQLVMQQPFWEDSPPIYVSPLLEQQATAEQKQRKIDLVDFLFEQRTGTD